MSKNDLCSDLAVSFSCCISHFAIQGLLCAGKSLVQPLALELELESLNCGVDMGKKLSRIWQNC